MKDSHISIALLVATALLAGLGVYASFWIFRQIDQSAEIRISSHVASNSAEDLLSALKDAETGERGFLLTGNVQALECNAALLSRGAWSAMLGH